jgi:hypothetical protein
VLEGVSEGWLLLIGTRDGVDVGVAVGLLEGGAEGDAEGETEGLPVNWYSILADAAASFSALSVELTSREDPDNRPAPGAP